MNFNIADALISLRPGAKFVVRGDVIEFYQHDNPQPTEAEIQAEIARLQAEQPWKELRQERNRLLAETDWVTIQSIDASVDGFGLQLPMDWMNYRQALRDLPANTTDPTNPVWPVKPGGAS